MEKEVKTLQIRKALGVVMLGLLLSVAGPWKIYAQNFSVGDLNYSVNEDGVSVTVTGTTYSSSSIIGESFENGIPSDWVTIDADGDGNNWELASWANHSGDNGVASASYLNGAITPDNYLVSGQVNFTANLGICFYACAYSSSYAAEHFGVAVSTGSQTDATDYTTIAEWTMTAKGDGSPQGDRGSRTQGSWYEYTVDLSSYAGQTGYVAIRHFGCTDQWYLNVDDVYIGEDAPPSYYTIPESVSFEGMDYLVTAIGDYAFYNCSNLTSIAFSNSVTSVGDNAFQNCGGLISVSFGNSLTSIGQYAFENCNNLTSIVFSDSVTSVGDYAFQNCIGLTSVSFGNSLTSIGQYAFEYCIGLDSVTIPNSVISVGDNAFQNCSGLTSVSFGNSLTSIGQYAFENCSGLASVTIPNSVTSVGDYAFQNCIGLTSVSFGNSLTSIGQFVFKNCASLTSVTIPDSVTSIGDYAFLNCSGLASVSFGDSLISIGQGVFYNCSSLTSVTIPNSVTSIGSSAFYGCSSLISVNIPDALVSIEYSTFHGCRALTSVTIPNSVTSIGTWAFSFCTSLVSVYYTGTVEQWCGIAFGGWIFSTGHDLYFDNQLVTDLVIPNSVTSIGQSAFQHCSGLISVTIPNSVTSIESQAFLYCTGLTSIEIPNSVTSIGDNVFYCCYGLTSVTIPNSMTSIGDYAFCYCNNLNSVYYSGTVEQWCGIAFGNWMFTRRHDLYFDNQLVMDLVIPNSVTSIGDGVFLCSNLTSIEIPNSVTSIGANAFRACSDLTYVTIYAVNPPILGEDAFLNVNTEIPVYVPCGYEESYISVSWGDFSNFNGMCAGEITVMANPSEGGMVYGGGSYGGGAMCTLTATANEGYSFISWTKDGTIVSDSESYSFIVVGDASYMANFEEEGVNISFADPNVKALCVAHWDTNGDGKLSYAEAATVTDLGQVFKSNSTITSFEELQYFTGLISIDEREFYRCNSLTSIVIPNAVVSIEHHAFYGCTALTSITIPNSVISIGDYAFGECTTLSSITIPNSVTSIGYGAFWQLYSLVSVSIPNSVTVIDGNPFERCYNLEQIVVDSQNPVYDSREGCNAIFETASNTLKVGCKNTVFPNSVTTIGDFAFDGCSGLTGSLTIPNSVTSIGDGAFQGCSGLTGSLTLPNSVTSIGSIAFSGCSGLTGSLTIPDSMTSIDYYTFDGCRALTSVTIPNTVTSIGSGAFCNCSDLTYVIIYAVNPPILGENAFLNVNTGIPVYVPCGVEDDYISVSWGDFSNFNGMCAGEITVMANPADWGTVTGGGYYEGGSICTLTATANTDYSFVNWTKNGVVVSSSETFSFIVGGDASYVGNFMKGVTIGSGTATNEYLPSYSYYNYTLSQQIYTAEEIGCDGTIKSVAFFNGGATKTRDYDVYMVSTEKTAFENTNDWIPVTGSNLVFSGQVTMNANEWTTLQFDTPFQYDGLSNIALVVDDNTGSWTYDPHMACRVFETQGNQAIRVYEDSPNYDPYNPSGYTGTLHSVKNQIILGFMTSTAHTIELSEGWNWISTYIDLNEVNGIAMLEEALGDYGVTIQTYNESADYFGDGEWSGLEDYEWTNAEMVMVEVTEDCTIALSGPTVAPGTVEIEINPGWNWIGFPLSTETAIEVAMGGFEPEEEDAIQSNAEGTSDYLGEWIGDVLTLVPGQGYMYYSNSTEPKTLVFSTTAGGKSVFLLKRKE